jgi:hypothetical protein
MKRLALITVALTSLVAAPTSGAGGMGAFVLSGPPAGAQAGDVWLAKVRVVGCSGQLVGSMAPTVVLLDQASGKRLRFRGVAAGPEGHYTARVVIPSAGSWSYRVNVGAMLIGQTRGPFKVSPAQKPDRLVAALPPLGAALLVLGTGLALRRRRRA